MACLGSAGRAYRHNPAMAALTTTEAVSVIVSATLTCITTIGLTAIWAWARKVHQRLAAIEQYQRDHTKDHQLIGSPDYGRHRVQRRR